jgi:hypothetical protein
MIFYARACYFYICLQLSHSDMVSVYITCIGLYLHKDSIMHESSGISSGQHAWSCTEC